MKIYKFAAPAALAFAGAIGVTALAADAPPPDTTLAQLDAFYVCNPGPVSPGMPLDVCIDVSDPRLTGLPCTISDDYGPLATLILQPGQNHAVVSTLSAGIVADGPGIEARGTSTNFPDNPGVN